MSTIQTSTHPDDITQPCNCISDSMVYAASTSLCNFGNNLCLHQTAIRHADMLTFLYCASFSWGLKLPPAELKNYCMHFIVYWAHHQSVRQFDSHMSWLQITVGQCFTEIKNAWRKWSKKTQGYLSCTQATHTHKTCWPYLNEKQRLKNNMRMCYYDLYHGLIKFLCDTLFRMCIILR